MAFTFNSTIGDAAANSYVDVQSADDYFGGKIDGDQWSNLGQTEKQQLLSTATVRLESEQYGGQVVDKIQRLQFPRDYVKSRNYPVETYYDNTLIPKEVQTATFELAMYFLQRSLDELGLSSEYDQETLKNYVVGPLNINMRSGMTIEKLPTPVKRALSAGGENLWLGGSSAGAFGRAATRG